jgi:hypothetical protein
MGHHRNMVGRRNHRLATKYSCAFWAPQQAHGSAVGSLGGSVVDIYGHLRFGLWDNRILLGLDAARFLWHFAS